MKSTAFYSMKAVFKILIKYVELYNIQNYKKVSKFKLSKKVTIFSGRNNTGKTTIGRCFKLFAGPVSEIKLKGLLRKKELEGYCALYLENGNKLVAKLTRVKRNKKSDQVKIRYEYVQCSDDTVLNRWLDYDDDILHILGWIRLDSKDGSILMNFKESATHIFMDAPASYNAKAFDSLCFNEWYDRKITNLNNAVKKESDILNLMVDKAKLISERFKACKWVDENYLKQVKTFYSQVKSNIELGVTQYNIYMTLLNIEQVKRSNSLLETEDELLHNKLLTLKTSFLLLLRQQIEQILLLHKIVQIKLLQKSLEIRKNLQETSIIKQLEFSSISNLASTSRNTKIIKDYVDSRVSEDLIGIISNIAKISSVKNSVKMKQQVEKNDIRLSSQVSFCKKWYQKIALNSYQKMYVLQHILGVLGVLVVEKREIFLLSQLTSLSEFLQKMQENGDTIEKNGQNVEIYKRLQNYKNMCNLYENIIKTAELVPTCPTCGKVYLSEERGHTHG